VMLERFRSSIRSGANLEHLAGLFVPRASLSGAVGHEYGMSRAGVEFWLEMIVLVPHNAKLNFNL
jgi:hypothetical protein